MKSSPYNASAESNLVALASQDFWMVGICEKAEMMEAHDKLHQQKKAPPLSVDGTDKR